MKSLLFASFLALLLFLSSASSGFADVLSTFDIDADGWTHAPGGDAGTTFAYKATGGVPGGRITLADSAQGQTDYFRAPAKFTGNLSGYYDGALQFDLMDNEKPSPDGLANAVVLTDASGNKLSHAAPSFSAGSYTAFTYALNERSGWTYTPFGGSPTVPTFTQFTNTLNAVASLDISGDLHDGKEISSLDNVSLTFAQFTGVVREVTGGTVTGQSGSAAYVAFGPPETGAFAGSFVTGKTKIPAVFGQDGALLLKVGGTVPGITGAIVAKLGAPSGDAVVVTLKTGPGGVTSQDNAVLVTGLSTGAPAMALRTGATPAGLAAGTVIKSFLGIDGNGTDIFFFAALESTSTHKSVVELCALLPNGDVTPLADNQNTMVDASDKVATLTTLVAGKGTAADGRWRADNTHIGVRVTFTNKTEAIYLIPSNAATPAAWALIEKTGAGQPLGSAVATGFGLPGFGPGATAQLATLKTGTGGVTTATDLALVVTGSAGSASLIAQKGALISADANGNPLTGVKISGMSDPVVGDSGRVAFMVTVAGKGAGPGIEYAADGLHPVLLANVGAMAPGGGTWSGFSALTMAKGQAVGPFFLGTLAVNKGQGVSGASNTGLWGVDRSGTLRLILRTGDSLVIGSTPKTVKKLATLVPALGSPGAASGYDDTGAVAVVVTFSDNSQALVAFTLGSG